MINFSKNLVKYPSIAMCLRTFEGAIVGANEGASEGVLQFQLDMTNHEFQSFEDISYNGSETRLLRSIYFKIINDSKYIFDKCSNIYFHAKNSNLM